MISTGWVFSLSDFSLGTEYFQQKKEEKKNNIDIILLLHTFLEYLGTDYVCTS